MTTTIMGSHSQPISKSPRDPQTKGPWLFKPLLKRPPETFFPAFFPSGLHRIRTQNLYVRLGYRAWGITALGYCSVDSIVK
nr:hypothetical protein Iba_chr11bCG11290 [Ipomoea batatas]